MILLRRLRLPLPLTSGTFAFWTSFGDRCAACAPPGILRRQGRPLERAIARICKEAGAGVATDTRGNDLNTSPPNQQDDRRTEVIPNALGTQLTAETTLVSPLTRDGPSLEMARRDAEQEGSQEPTGCRQRQRKNVPRIPQQTPLPFGRTCNGDRTRIYEDHQLRLGPARAKQASTILQ